MKKKMFIPGLLLIMSALSLSSCGDDPAHGQNGKGCIAPVVGVDTGFLGAEIISRAGEETRKVEDLSLTLTKADGSFEKTWPSVKDFDSEEQFPIGDYTIEVKYGDRKAEGFRAEAAYHASQDIKVMEATTTPVELTARRTHAMISIRYTDAFEHYIKEGSVDVVTSTGRGITFDYSDDNPETRSALIVPGRTRILLDIEKYNGTVAENMQVADFETEAAKHYVVTIDVNKGELGTPSLNITIDDDCEEIILDPIDISDEMLNAPAPEISIDGVENGGQISVIEGCYDGTPIKVLVIARGELASIDMNVISSSLRRDAHWEAAQDNNQSINLIALPKEQQGKYTDWGLACHGVWNRPDRMAVVDFTDVVNNIPYLSTDEGLLDNVSKFELSATDKNGKKTETPVSFSIKISPISYSISNPSKEKLLLFDNEIDVDFEFNGGRPDEKGVVFEVFGNSWNKTEYTVARDLGNGKYRIHIADLPDYCETVKIRAIFNSKAPSNEISIPREQYNITTAEGDIDVYAKFAYVTLGTEDTNPASIASKVTFWNGDQQLESERVGNTAMFKVKGLTPGSANTIKASLFDDPFKASTELTLNTETTDTSLNSTFETGFTTVESESHWENIALPTPWGTNNPMTTSQGANYAYCRISGTIQTSDGNHGSAVVIRTVGWGSGNSATGSGGASGATKYTDAGLMHVGSSRSTRPNGYSNREGALSTDDLVCGTNFKSRPSLFKFSYKYVAKNPEDLGYVEFWIKDKDGNLIVRKEATLIPTDSYTENIINIDYEPGMNKAETIYIKFLSTNDRKFLAKTDQNFSGPGFGNLSRGTFMGSQLYIDDIELVY